MDHLEEIENSIRRARLSKGIYPRQLIDKGFVAPTVYRIEKHGNYSVATLFRLLDYFGLTLLVDGKEAKDMETLGSLLRDIRLVKNYSQLDIVYTSRLSSSRIIAVEHGRDYEKKTLNTYLDALGTTLSIKE